LSKKGVLQYPAFSLFKGDRIFLMAENADYPPIEVSELEELHIWGVVTCVMHLL
jgi:SOS-response transcriptional repressor LexA